MSDHRLVLQLLCILNDDNSDAEEDALWLRTAEVALHPVPELNENDYAKETLVVENIGALSTAWIAAKNWSKKMRENCVRQKSCDVICERPRIHLFSTI